MRPQHCPVQSANIWPAALEDALTARLEYFNQQQSHGHQLVTGRDSMHKCMTCAENVIIYESHSRGLPVYMPSH